MTKALYVLPVLALLGMLSAAHAQQDTQPPALSAVEFNTDTRVLKFTFNETIDASETDITKFRITNGGNSFEIDGTLESTEDSDTVEFSINQGQANAIGNGRGYSIGDDAVKDLNGNSFTATTGGSIPLTSDTTPPSVVSATLDTGTRILTVVFDEPIDPNAANRVHYYSGGNFLPVDMDHNGSSPDTLTKDVGEAVLAEIVAQPRVHINAGHVRDTSGNAVGQTDNIPVTVLDTTPPSFVSATLNTFTRILTLVFDEIIDVSQLDLTRITVLGLAENGNTESVHLGFQSSPYVTGNGSDSDTVAIANMSERIFAIHNITRVGTSGSIFDTHGNEIQPQSYPLQTVDTPPPDTTPPSFVSGVYDRGTATLTIMFDETIDVSRIDREGITLAGFGLLQAMIDTEGDSDTVVMTVPPPIAEFIAGYSSYLLQLDADAVRDLAGNGNAFGGRPIDVEGPAPDATPPAPLSAELDTFARTLTMVFDEAIDVSGIAFDRITVEGSDEHGGSDGFHLAYRGSPYVVGGADSATVVIANVSERIFAIYNITHVSIDRDDAISDIDGNGVPVQRIPLQVVDTQPPIGTQPPADREPPAKRQSLTTGGFKTTSVLASHAISYNVCDPARAGAVQVLTFNRPHIGEVGLNVYAADSVSFGADVTGSVPASAYLTRVSPDYVYTVWTAEVRQGAGEFFVTVFDRDDGRTASAVLVDAGSTGCAGTVFPHDLKDARAEFLPIEDIEQ